MIEIEEHDITHTRGDTAILIFSFTDKGAAYELQAGDKAVFSVKAAFDSKEYLIHKELVGNKLVLQPDDTAKLEAGKYVYDIQITRANGDVYTPIVAKYKLTADVTRGL